MTYRLFCTTVSLTHTQKFVIKNDSKEGAMKTKLFSRFSFREFIVLVALAIAAAVVGPRALAAVQVGELTPAEQLFQEGWYFITSLIEGEEEAPAVPDAPAVPTAEDGEVDGLLGEAEEQVEAAEDASLTWQSAQAMGEYPEQVQSGALRNAEAAVRELEIIYQRVERLGGTPAQRLEVGLALRLAWEIVKNMQR